MEKPKDPDDPAQTPTMASDPSSAGARRRGELRRPAADGERYRILRPHAKGGLGAVFVEREAVALRAVELLRRAVGGGYGSRAEFESDTDLDPLRGRADFAEVIQSVPAK